MFFLSACLDSLKRKQMFEMSESCRVNTVCRTRRLGHAVLRSSAASWAVSDSTAIRAVHVRVSACMLVCVTTEAL